MVASVICIEHDRCRAPAGSFDWPRATRVLSLSGCVTLHRGAARHLVSRSAKAVQDKHLIQRRRGRWNRERRGAPRVKIPPDKVVIIGSPEGAADRSAVRPPHPLWAIRSAIDVCHCGLDPNAKKAGTDEGAALVLLPCPGLDQRTDITDDQTFCSNQSAVPPDSDGTRTGRRG
jgi:hypothetical protein